MNSLLLKPTPEEIRQAREAAGLTQTQAAKLVHSPCRTWQNWETRKGSTENRAMPLASWELFTIKVERLKNA